MATEFIIANSQIVEGKDFNHLLQKEQVKVWMIITDEKLKGINNSETSLKHISMYLFL